MSTARPDDSPDMRRAVTPPRLASLLLRCLGPRKHAEFLLGDLEEGFHDRVDSPLGLPGARRWYWRQAWLGVTRAAPPADLAKTTGTSGMPPDGLRRDLRLAARSLAKTPAFTATAVFTLALGIGPTTALFSVVDAVLLRPLPFQDPDRLVVIWETDRSDGDRRWRVAPANFLDWKAQARSLEDAAAFGAYAATLTGDGDPRPIRGAAVTASYLSVLGLRPILGRDFTPGDETAGTPVVLLGHGLWRSRFGGSASVLGSTVILDGAPRTVIGVMPPGLAPTWPVNGPRLHFQADRQDAFVLLPARLRSNRRSHLLGVVARLKPDVTRAAAQRDLEAVARRLGQTHAENANVGVSVRPLLDEVAGVVRPALLILLAAVACVLLIACSNVAGLLLARLATRRKEIAVRRAMGAGDAALLRPFVAEGLLLAILAGTLGTALAALCERSLVGLVPGDVPRLAEVSLDLRVLAFTLGVSVLAALLFTLAPAWAALRLNISDALKDTARGPEGGAPQHTRQLLVVAQVSIAVILTVATGLLARSFRGLALVDPGFRPARLLVADLVLPGSRYPRWQDVAGFYGRLIARVRGLPGVVSAGLAYDHPLETNWLTGFSIEGLPDEDARSVQLRIVAPGTFAATGQRLPEGRDFTDGDGGTRPGVAIVSESFVKRYVPGGRALGRTLRSSSAAVAGAGLPDRFTIVGVAADIRPPRLGATSEPFLYLCAWQMPVPDMKLLVRSSGDPTSAIGDVRQAVRDLDRGLALARVATMESVVADGVAQPRLSLALMAAFGALAVALSLVGVYGLIACWVTARRGELAVRVALGANPRDLVGLVLDRAGRLVLGGVLGGVGAALVVSRAMQSQLFGVSPSDPLTYATVPVLVLAAGLLASLVPARRAARVDPMEAFRDA